MNRFQVGKEFYEASDEALNWLFIFLEWDWLRAAELSGLEFAAWHGLSRERRLKLLAVKLGVARRWQPTAQADVNDDSQRRLF